MLKQITVQEALKMYLDEISDIKVLKPGTNSGRLIMYNMEEIFKDSICLVDESKISNIDDTENNSDTKSKRTKIDEEKLFALYNEKWTAKAIADELGCSIACVYNHLNKIK